MTKKNLLLIGFGVVLLFALLESGVFDAIFIFLFVGAIPGTSFSIPPFVMLALLLGAIVVFTHWVASRQLYPGSPKVVANKDKVLRKTARKKVTKKSAKSVASTRRRRYSQLEA